MQDTTAAAGGQSGQAARRVRLAPAPDPPRNDQRPSNQAISAGTPSPPEPNARRATNNEKDPRSIAARRVFVAALAAHGTDAAQLRPPRRGVAGSITRGRQRRARKRVHRISGSGSMQAESRRADTASTTCGRSSGQREGTRREVPARAGRQLDAASGQRAHRCLDRVFHRLNRFADKPAWSHHFFCLSLGLLLVAVLG